MIQREELVRQCIRTHYNPPDMGYVGSLSNADGPCIQVLTTRDILGLPMDESRHLRNELASLFQSGFPRMPSAMIITRAGEFFRAPGGSFNRHAILVRDPAGTLVASKLFDHGDVHHRGQRLSALYSLSACVRPEYQGSGLGTGMTVSQFKAWRPGVLMVTCSQSVSLWTWISLPIKGLIENYEMYPRLERQDGRDALVAIPPADLDLAVSVFRQTFLGVVDGDTGRVETALNNLTVRMTRKNLYCELYEHPPWERNGVRDKLAEALDVTSKDGICLFFRRIG